MFDEPVKCASDQRPVIVVDDNAVDLVIAERVYRLSELQNPLMMFEDGAGFLAYMDEVGRGESLMPAVVLLDLNMIGLSGHEVLSRVRSDQRFDHEPPVVILTNSDNPEDVERARSGGANGYVSKPADIDHYVAFLNGLASG